LRRCKLHNIDLLEILLRKLLRVHLPIVPGTAKDAALLAIG
jgi:hypothetical protein